MSGEAVAAASGGRGPRWDVLTFGEAMLSVRTGGPLAVGADARVAVSANAG